MNVHLKGGEILGRQTAQVIAQNDRLHQTFLACDVAAARGAKSVAAEIMICNMEKQSDSWNYVEETLRLKTEFIQLYGGLSTTIREYVAVLKAKDIRINYFGTDDVEELLALFDYGVEFPLVNDIRESMKVATGLGMQPLVPIFGDANGQ